MQATDKLVIIDIETVPCFPDFCEMPQEWQKLWSEKVQRSLPPDTTAEDYYGQRAGVMAEFSKIVCISMGYFFRDLNLQLKIKSFAGDDEGELLHSFIETLDRIEFQSNKWSFAGHNIKEFDIPFLCRRMLINGLRIPPYLDFQNMKPWETNLVDTFQLWRFGDYKHYTSLPLLAACLGVPTPKDDIDGSMVADIYWKTNDLNRIVKYCQKDVEAVANILLRFHQMPLLHPDDVHIVG